MNKLSILLFGIVTPIIAFTQNLANFTQVGPVLFPLNPSVQTTGMGRVSQLVYHPTDSNVLFAVSASGGVFKSSNEGTSWKPISDFLPQTACASLAINPKNPKVMYLGTGDANYNAGGMGVWKTLNGGISWFQSTYGLGNKLVSYILLTPNDTTTVIAACSDGIYKSTDAGSSWTRKSSVAASYRDLVYQPFSNRIIYAATSSSFYCSFDNGNSWIQSTINNKITCAGIKIAVCPKDTSKLFCVVWKSGASSPFGGVYKSTNNGSNFTLMVDTPNILGYSSDGRSMDGQGAYNLAIACDPKNSNTLYVGAITIWKSTNEGANFTLKSPWAYGVHADKHGFLFSPTNANKLFVYHDGGLDRSTDGGNTWKTLEDGLSASEFYKIGSSGLYNDYLIGGLQDNGMDVASDKKFSTVRGGDWGGDFAFDAFVSKLIYENGGLKRDILTHSTGNIRGHGGIYLVHPNDSNVMFEITTDLFRANNLRVVPDSNIVWKQITTFSGNTSPKSLAYSKASKGTFYFSFSSQAIYKSININAVSPSFAKITTFPFKSGEEIKQIESCNYDSNVIYVLTSQSRILKSRDKGATWTALNKNLPNTTVIKFLLDQKLNDSSMYVCTAFGVYFRNKNLANWINFSKGLPTIAQISDMEIMSDGTSNGRLHISTFGRGIWQTDLYNKTAITPDAEFVVQPSTAPGCSNTIILVDNSTGSPNWRKWQITPNKGWSFINGSDTLSARAEIQFNTSGVYFVTLTVGNNQGTSIKSLNYNHSALTPAASCITTTNILGGFGIGIFRFELNGIDKSSGEGKTSYDDFSCNNSTFLKSGTNYTSWVTSGAYNNENVKIYIDYNNNGLFTDANELAGTITSSKGRRSCTITTLASPPVLNKFLRLRVISDFNAISAPCGALGYGQSEDYAVFFDKVKPFAVINIPKPTISNGFKAVFKLSEVVIGFDINDLTVSNATLSNFKQIDALNYSVSISPFDNGRVKLNVIGNGFEDIAGNLSSATSDSTLFFLGIKSFTFSGLSTNDSILQTPKGGSIVCKVPFGEKLDTLQASFTLSDSSVALVVNKLQMTKVSKNNFNSIVNYNIKSKDSSITKTYSVKLEINKNTECKILNYALSNPFVTGIIKYTSAYGTIELTVPYGQNVSNILASFILSDSAKAYIKGIKQISNLTYNNFSTPILYKVIAQDTSFSKEYLINILYGKSTSCDLLSFALKTPSTVGVIAPTGNKSGTVKVTVPFSTSLIGLTALFTVSDSAKVYIKNTRQISDLSINNYESTLVYNVTAQDTSFSKTYLVSLFITPNKAAELLTYSISSFPGSGVISPIATGGFVNLTLPYASNLTNLKAKFTLSDSAKAYINGKLQQNAFTPNNFIDTLLFIVKAQDNFTTKTYKISVVTGEASITDLGDKKLIIYPSPASNDLHVSTNNLKSNNNEFRIINALGQRTVLKGYLNKRDNLIDISRLGAGVYIIQIINEDEVVVGKFIKN